MMKKLHTTREAARFAALPVNRDTEHGIATGERLIECNFRSPARFAAVAIPNDAWAQLRERVTDGNYLTLLDAVLERAAKSILSTRIENMSVFPTEIDTTIFSADAILNEAVGNNSEWLSKDELTKLWETSATRKKYISDARYTSNKQYAAAVNNFADMILKLAGKTTVYKPEECDTLLAKMVADDMDTELGNFVARRLDMIRNKPAKEIVNWADML